MTKGEHARSNILFELRRDEWVPTFRMITAGGHRFSQYVMQLRRRGYDIRRERRGDVYYYHLVLPGEQSNMFAQTPGSAA